MRTQGATIRRIQAAVTHGRLAEPFSARDVNGVLGIHWAGTFLPKHRVGNPGGQTELFVRVSRRPARYRLVEFGCPRRWSQT